MKIEEVQLNELDKKSPKRFIMRIKAIKSELRLIKLLKNGRIRNDDIGIAHHLIDNAGKHFRANAWTALQNDLSELDKLLVDY